MDEHYPATPSSTRAEATTRARPPPETRSRRKPCARAGIGYHEVIAGQTTPAEMRRLVEKLVDKPGEGLKDTIWRYQSREP